MVGRRCRKRKAAPHSTQGGRHLPFTLARSLVAVVLLHVFAHAALGSLASQVCESSDAEACGHALGGDSSGGARSGARPAGGAGWYVASCVIFRDEDRFLREWLAFHLCTGVMPSLEHGGKGLRVCSA